MSQNAEPQNAQTASQDSFVVPAAIVILSIVLLATGAHAAGNNNNAVDADELLSEAAKAARRARDPQTRALSLATVAAAEAKRGNEPQYRQLLKLAVECAQGARTKMSTVMALRTIAVRIAPIDADTALTVIDEAAKRCEKLASPIQKGAAYRELMIAADGVDSDKLEQLRQKAVANTNDIQQPLMRSAAERDLAVALAEIDPQAARDHFTKAQSALSGNDGNGGTAFDLARLQLATAWAPINWPAAKKVIDEVQTDAMSSSALVTVGVKLAEQDPDRALAMAGGVPVDGGRATIVAAAAASVDAELGSVSRELAERALNMIGDATGGAAATTKRYASIALASSSVSRAVSIAEAITDSRQKQAAIIGIARRIMARNPEKAIELAKNYKGATGAEKVLSEAAVRLAGSDPGAALSIVRQLASRRRRVEAFVGVAAQLPQESNR